MKKLVALFLGSLMLFSLTACGADAGKSASKADDKKAAQSGAAEKKSDTLVVYFSCTGNTKKLAETTAAALNADIYEIKPAKPYSARDLDYNDKTTRSTVEQNDEKARPELLDKNANIAAYKRIVIAYPIWWGIAPRIIDTFVESYDFTGKTIIPICTSGGSGIGRSAEYLQTIMKGKADWKNGKLFNSATSKDEIKSFIDGL